MNLIIFHSKILPSEYKRKMMQSEMGNYLSAIEE